MFVTPRYLTLKNGSLKVSEVPAVDEVRTHDTDPIETAYDNSLSCGVQY